MNLFNFKPIFYHIKTHVSFFQSTGVLGAHDFLLLTFLSTVAVVFELLGFFSLYPILSFIEANFEVTVFENSSKANAMIQQAYSWAGLEITLANLMIFSFLMIFFRQLTTYVFSIKSENLKWKVGQQLGALVFSKVLNSKLSYIKSFSRGAFTVSVDNECQGTATLPIAYIEIWKNTLIFASVISVTIFASPGPGISSIIVILVIALALRRILEKIRS